MMLVATSITPARSSLSSPLASKLRPVLSSFTRKASLDPSLVSAYREAVVSCLSTTVMLVLLTSLSMMAGKLSVSLDICLACMKERLPLSRSSANVSVWEEEGTSHTLTGSWTGQVRSARPEQLRTSSVTSCLEPGSNLTGRDLDLLTPGTDTSQMSADITNSYLA